MEEMDVFKINGDDDEFFFFNPIFGIEVENQLLQKSFPDFSISSLILASWYEGGHPTTKITPTLPWMDNCLMVTERDFLEMEVSLWLKRVIPSVTKGWLSTNDYHMLLGKQPSIPWLILEENGCWVDDN